MRRIASFAPLLLALLAPAAAAAQEIHPVRESEERPRGTSRRASRTERDDRGDASRHVLYSASSGSLQNVPLIAGRTYTFEVKDLNPLCYSYSAEIAVKEENTDLSKIIAAFGTLPGAPAAAAGDPEARPDPVNEMAGGEGLAESESEKVAEARGLVESAEESLLRLEAEMTAVEAAAKEVTSPVCSRNAPFAPVRDRWSSLETVRERVVARTDLKSARSDLQDARTILAGVRRAARSPVEGDLSKASEKADELAKELGTLVPALLVADGTMRAAVGAQEFRTQAFLPANTESAQIVIRTVELHPASGKAAAESELKTGLPVRRGMRVFLSAGFLASMAGSRDYARVNRPCSAGAEPDCEGTYSTYADKGAGRPFAFSPVLQVNVAFRDIWSSGASLHTSAGVAARSVNGTVSPEFILGAGTGLVDRLLLTAGIHIARDERLLLGEPGQVRQLSVPDQITEADAVGTTWRPAFVLTTTLRLND